MLVLVLVLECSIGRPKLLSDMLAHDASILKRPHTVFTVLTAHTLTRIYALKHLNVTYMYKRISMIPLPALVHVLCQTWSPRSSGFQHVRTTEWTVGLNRHIHPNPQSVQSLGLRCCLQTLLFSGSSYSFHAPLHALLVYER
jgi:hypothetical protein